MGGLRRGVERRWTAHAHWRGAAANAEDKNRDDDGAPHNPQYCPAAPWFPCLAPDGLGTTYSGRQSDASPPPGPFPKARSRRWLRPSRLSREPRAHVRLVLVVEMRKERSAAHRRALHPRKASGIVERGLRKFLDRRRELLKDATRLR